MKGEFYLFQIEYVIKTVCRSTQNVFLCLFITRKTKSGKKTQIHNFNFNVFPWHRTKLISTVILQTSVKLVQEFIT